MKQTFFSSASIRRNRFVSLSLLPARARAFKLPLFRILFSAASVFLVPRSLWESSVFSESADAGCLQSTMMPTSIHRSSISRPLLPPLSRPALSSPRSSRAHASAQASRGQVPTPLQQLSCIRAPKGTKERHSNPLFQRHRQTTTTAAAATATSSTPGSSGTSSTSNGTSSSSAPEEKRFDAVALGNICVDIFIPVDEVSGGERVERKQRDKKRGRKRNEKNTRPFSKKKKTQPSLDGQKKTFDEKPRSLRSTSSRRTRPSAGSRAPSRPLQLPGWMEAEGAEEEEEEEERETGRAEAASAAAATAEEQQQRRR